MKLNLKDMVDTLGYEVGYEAGGLFGEIEKEAEEVEREIDLLLGELGTEELGFFKSISKAFKRVFKGVKKVFRKPLKIVKKPLKVVRKPIKAVKKLGTKAWKLVRRNKRTLTAIGLLWAGKYIPALRPVATEYASYQASHLASKYLAPALPPAPSTSTSEGAFVVPYPLPDPAVSARKKQTGRNPRERVYRSKPSKDELVKVLLPIGALLAGVYLFRRK
ncbi:MAG: hypothetical protein GXO39_08870 [Thermotogae bacterium]|nr:hypothetical protein [Thermotogota bacterium]